MNCKHCGKEICVEEATSYKGYCVGCYLVLPRLGRSLVEVFRNVFADRVLSTDRLGRLGLRRKDG